MTTEAKAPEAEYLRGYNDGWHDGYATADTGLLEALEGLVNALAANDEDGMTEFADVVANARAALLEALEGLVNALAANDEDGMTEFADVMVNARAVIAAAKGASH
jgi:rhamnogalacturonyl hydrolase YesR